MRRVRNTAFSALLCALTALTVLTLAFVIYFKRLLYQCD